MHLLFFIVVFCSLIISIVSIKQERYYTKKTGVSVLYTCQDVTCMLLVQTYITSLVKHFMGKYCPVYARRKGNLPGIVIQGMFIIYDFVFLKDIMLHDVSWSLRKGTTLTWELPSNKNCYMPYIVDIILVGVPFLRYIGCWYGNNKTSRKKFTYILLFNVSPLKMQTVLRITFTI